MRVPDETHKHFASARERFLGKSIETFLKREFPRYFGPVVRHSIARELVALIRAQLPPREFLRPGQCVWNAVSIRTRPDHPRREFVPVVLTLIAEDDIQKLLQHGSMQKLGMNAVARITREAHQQGGLLSMRDIGLLVWRHGAHVSNLRQRWEQQHRQLLPHPGSLQDFGSCLSHKTTIIQKVIYQKKDPRQVARETRHSQAAVDRYLRDFHRVRTAYLPSRDLDFVCQTTGLSRHLVQQLIQIIEKEEFPD